MDQKKLYSATYNKEIDQSNINSSCDHHITNKAEATLFIVKLPERTLMRLTMSSTKDSGVPNGSKFPIDLLTND